MTPCFGKLTLNYSEIFVPRFRKIQKMDDGKAYAHIILHEFIWRRGKIKKKIKNERIRAQIKYSLS